LTSKVALMRIVGAASVRTVAVRVTVTALAAVNRPGAMVAVTTAVAAVAGAVAAGIDGAAMAWLPRAWDQLTKPGTILSMGSEVASSF